MGTFDFWKIVLATVAFGAASEAVRRYRTYKAARLTLPSAERNAGFWTDRRIVRAEAVGCALALAPPWTYLVLAVASHGNLWYPCAALAAYPVAIYIMMRGFRPRLPQ